jgi:hypothetical protein
MVFFPDHPPRAESFEWWKKLAVMDTDPAKWKNARWILETDFGGDTYA